MISVCFPPEWVEFRSAFPFTPREEKRKEAGITWGGRQ